MRYARPISSISALTSPIVPWRIPRKSEPIDSDGMLAPGTEDSRYDAPSPADENTDRRENGAVNTSRREGMSSVRTAKPPSAGLITVRPLPPSAHLNTPIPTAEASIGTQNETEGGMSMPTVTPLHTAERSDTVTRCRNSCSSTSSVSTAAPTEQMITARQRTPKRNTAHIIAGSVATSISAYMAVTGLPDVMNGAPCPRTGRGRAIRSRFARRASLSAAPYAIGTAALTAEECAGTAGAAERSERLPDVPREFASQVRCGFITGIFFAFPASALTELRFSAEILSAGALFKEQDSM